MSNRIHDLLPAVTAHLIVSTAFLLLCVAAVWTFRERLTAAARFAIVFAGIAKFAIPGVLLSPVVKLLSPESARDASPGGIEASVALLGEAFRFEPPPVSATAWTSIALGTWLLVTIALIGRAAVTRQRLTALSLRTAVPPAAREVAALARVRQRMEIRRSIDIARSALPEAPAVLRVFRPVIVLPMHTCDELTDEELESLLGHECAHVTRHDNLSARLEWLICSLFWFHPLVWIAQRITALERERACDEAVAASPEEGERYRSALVKFCHAVIVPRQPGVSCMATAILKERIEHVMNYPRLKLHSPSTPRVAAAAVAALALFTLFSAFSGSAALLAATKPDQPYSVRIAVERSGRTMWLRGRVAEAGTQKLIAEPHMSFDAGQPARATFSASGLEVLFDVQPTASEWLEVEVNIRRDGVVEQHAAVRVIPAIAQASEPARYSGQPITLRLEDAEIGDLLNTFGGLTGLDVRVDRDVTGRVSVSWVNVPWDEAFDSLLQEHGLTYKIDGSVIRVSKK